MSYVAAAAAQWAKTVIWRTFGHSSGKKHDTDVFLGSLEAFYEGGHEKMTKSEIWGTMGDWGQITKFTNFCSRCPEMTQTWKATLLEAEKSHVAKPKWPIFGKIRKNNVLFSILAVFWPENGEKRPFLVVGWLRKVLFYRVEVYDLFQNWWRNVRILSGWLVAKPDLEN